VCGKVSSTFLIACRIYMLYLYVMEIERWCILFDWLCETEEFLKCACMELFCDHIMVAIYLFLKVELAKGILVCLYREVELLCSTSIRMKRKSNY